MKISLALGPGQPLSRQTAWGCFTMNLAMPGAGSLAAGRKVGYFQAALSLLGLTLTLTFGLNFFFWFFKNYSAVMQSNEYDPLAGLRLMWPELRLPLLGIGLFALALVWALFSSIGILARVKAEPARPMPPPLQ